MIISKLTRKLIAELLFDKNNKPNPNYYYKLKPFNIDLNGFVNINEYLYFIYNELTEKPKCLCGNSLKYISFSKGYKEFCKSTCNPNKKKQTKRTYTKLYSLTIDNLDFFITADKVNKKANYLTIPEEYSFVNSNSEYIYCFKHNILKPPLCDCSKTLKFKSFLEGYSKACSSKCAGKLESTINKRKETCLIKYGVDIVSKLEINTEKAKKTKLQKYGIENYNNNNKRKETCLIKYGVDNLFRDIQKRKTWEVNRVSNIRNNSTQPNEWILRPNFVDVNLNKRKETCLDRYGVEHYVQSQAAQKQMNERVQKIWSTKKNNGTTNSSKMEEKIFSILNNLFTVKREYQTEKYPFNCDFYIVELDLFIEYQGYFTHGKEAFLNSKEDKNTLNKWKNKEGTFYKNAIINWTIRDVKKRETAIANNLNLLEIFSIDKDNIEKDLLTQINRFLDLDLSYNEEELKQEYKNINNRQGKLEAKPTHNKLIKHFHKHFYKKEKELFKNPIIRRKLIKNRIKYLNKNESQLSNREHLLGCKISGIQNGYSFFSPIWFKWFIETYHVNKVYDPFGGWGHRLLGAAPLDLYIYNDISPLTFNSTKKMSDFLELNNIEFFNNDMLDFIPDDDFDAIFTCPPYEDLEVYEIKRKNQFKKYINHMFKIFNVKKCNIMGIVLPESLESYLPYFDKKMIVNNTVNHFKTKKTFEYLYIIEKKLHNFVL